MYAAVELLSSAIRGRSLRSTSQISTFFLPNAKFSQAVAAAERPKDLNERIDGSPELRENFLFPLRWHAEINVILMRTQVTRENQFRDRYLRIDCSTQLFVALPLNGETSYGGVAVRATIVGLFSSPWRNQVLPNDGTCNEDSGDSAVG